MMLQTMIVPEIANKIVAALQESGSQSGCVLPLFTASNVAHMMPSPDKRRVAAIIIPRGGVMAENVKGCIYN